LTWNLSICRDSDLQGDFWDNQLQRDKYYVQDTTFLQNEQEKARKKREEDERKEFKPRTIVHPYFQNISMDDALKVIIILL
jgi:transcription elongation factor SPT6